ncbi:hypothetical protein [Saccharibacillus sp. JS10]|uniref:hypothetical protein n=1 Tax=Saccharibacillus sp. JS10 TaxID=2950552 RepID=UPI00210B2C83|nr:hypothetical protein [Saccharibacillus sp. JS10]MCQ4087368.1 hypothetical protein [Saccharibacillus sp. JS10]
MNRLDVVQLEAKPGLLIASIKEGRASRLVEVPLRIASDTQQAEWQRLAGRSAIDLYHLLEQSGESIVLRTGATKAKRHSAAESSGAAEPSDAPLSIGFDDADDDSDFDVAVETNDEGMSFVRTELPFDSGDAAWELAALEASGEDVNAALEAAAKQIRTHLAFGLTLAGMNPGELANAALAAWGDGWTVAPDEALKAAPRAASEGGGKEIAEWIASAAEKGVLHEHGRLPEAPAGNPQGAEPQPCDLSLLPDAAPAQAALAELRKAMRSRISG